MWKGQKSVISSFSSNKMKIPDEQIVFLSYEEFQVEERPLSAFNTHNICTAYSGHPTSLLHALLKIYTTFTLHVFFTHWSKYIPRLHG